MKNLYYDLPLDVREIINKKVKDMIFRDGLLAELKAFDRLAWSTRRWTLKKFPYNTDTFYDILIECITKFYEANEKRYAEFMGIPIFNRITLEEMYDNELLKRIKTSHY